MKLTKNQQEFIGTTFYVERIGATLSVTGVIGKDKSSAAIFSVDCTICSKDTELFPAGFSIRKNHLQNKEGCLNRIPCGCSVHSKWTDEQDELLTQRVLDETQPNLKVVGSETIKGKLRKFILECNVCSIDTELWPEGRIMSIKNSLVEGVIPCGCSVKPEWTEEQFKIRIKRECKLRGYIFRGWDLSQSEGKFKGSVTKLDLENPKTGNRWQSTNINGFFNGGGGIADCKQRQKELGVFYGYYPHRKMEQDNLYVIRFKNDETIKVGRAFGVDSRIHNSGSGLLKTSKHQLSDIEILYVMKGTHQEVYNTEQWVHKELTERGFHASWIPWTTECFTEDSEDMIYRLLDESGLVDGEW